MQVLFFLSNIPRHREDLPSLHYNENTVYMYRNEPAVLGVWTEASGQQDRFLRIKPTDASFQADVISTYADRIGSVDRGESAVSSLAGISREAFVEIRPRGEVGETHSYNVSVANYDGSAEKIVPLNITLIESQSARLASLSVSPGRLDPEFNMDRLEYLVRVPPPQNWADQAAARESVEDNSSWASSYLNFQFATLNDRDASCSMDGGETWHEARGKLRLNLLDTDIHQAILDRTPLEIVCRSADRTKTTKYPLTIVPQYGGDTLLTNLQVLGGDLAEQFDPNKHGVYRADLVKGALKDGSEREFGWTRVAVRRNNPRAIVTVDGHECASPSAPSPLFAKDMLVSHWIKVPRGEKRVVDIVVSTPENPVPEIYQLAITRETSRNWWTTASGLRASNWLGWLSTIFSGRNAASILNNNKVLDILSLYGHHAGANEIYNDFATPFHLWNSEPTHPCNSEGVVSRWLKIKSPQGDVLNCGVPALDYDEAHGPILDELVSTIRHFTPYDEPVDAEIKARKSADGTWRMSTTQPATTSPTATTTTATTSSADTTTPTTTTTTTTTTTAAASSSVGASRRKLISVTAEEREAFRAALDSRWKTQQNFYYYVMSLIYVGGVLSVGIGGYAVLYFVILRDPASGRLRCDYPACLQPGRFLTFVLDVSFVGLVTGGFGVLFTSREIVGGIELTPLNMMRISLSKPLLNAWAVIVLMLAIGYVVAGSLALAGVAEKIGYSAQFCTYHDLMMTHGRAIYTPGWARNIPLLRRLLAVNIDAVVPLKASQIPGSQAVGFTAVQTPSEGGGGAASSYYQSLYVAGDKYVCEDGPEMRDAKSIQVGINDYLYNDQATNYDGRNHQIYGKYPEAKFGETKFSLRNSYGYKVNVQSDLQIQHLTSLMQLIDDFRFWLPQKFCYFPHSDGLRNLLTLGPSTGGDATAAKDLFNAGLFYDWSVNRSLLFVTLGVAEFFGQRDHSPTLALYSVVIFSLASATIRLPSALYSASAKYQRDVRLRARYQKEEVTQAVVRGRQADRIWPFTEPGFMDRFKGIQRRKQDQQAFGMLKLLRTLGLASTPAAADDVLLDEGAHTAEAAFTSTESFYKLAEVACSPCGADLVLAVIGGLLLLANVKRESDGLATVGSVGAIAATALMLLLVNVRSLTVVARLLSESADCILQKTAELGIHAANLVRSASDWGEIARYYFEQIMKSASFDPTANYSFPTQPIAVRKFPVESVAVVSNELGLQFPGVVAAPELYDRVTVPDQKRLRLYKTLVVHGGLGASRARIYSSLPIQVPFSKLLHDDGAPSLNPDADFGRIVATIQVVNHTLRANAAGLSALANDEHDSFLTLYAHPKLLPEPGRVLIRKDGHTYSVRFDAANRKLVVRGPSVVADKLYSLRTSKSAAASTAAVYLDGKTPDRSLSSISSEELPVGRAATALALCEAPGALRVQVPAQNEPWLYQSIIISPTPAAKARISGAERFEIDPCDIKVYYDRDCGELFLRHESLRSGAEYEVEWVIAPAAPAPLELSARAQENGCIVFDTPAEMMPDLKNWMVLKDAASGAVIDIDPKQTDAYQFFFPENRLGFFQTFANHVASLGQMIKGGDRESETMEEPIPCTVVQCVNPLQKIYRVDPNFAEGRRILAARLHELRAKQRAAEESGDSRTLAMLWPSLLKNHDYQRFWSERGVHVTDEFGNILDPLSETAHIDLYHAQLREVAAGESELRSLLSAMLDEKLEKVSRQLDAVQVWERAYNDPILHTSQLQTDIGEWSASGGGFGGVGSGGMSVLESQKALYSSRVAGFFYPCNVPDALIMKRPNLSAQFRLWSNILQSWLFVEEGVDVSSPETRVRISAIVRDIMQSLKFVIHGNELVSRNQYKSVLHYVIGSHALRGVDAFWKPDSLKAHTALVRIWTEDESKENAADFSKYPEWLPCLLRLTPQALQILLPNGDDLVRPVNGDLAFPWQKSTGLYVPLHAFHKFELIDEPAVGEGAHQDESSNVLLNFMTTRLVCRKNQRDRIPDSYAQRVEDDNVGNEICFTDTTGQRRMKYRMMIGHTVSEAEARAYPQDEVDPQLSGPDVGVNVFPLSFRMSPAFAAQWRRAIAMSRLDTPHDFSFAVPDVLSAADDSPKPASLRADSFTTDHDQEDDAPSELSLPTPPPPVVVVPPSLSSSSEEEPVVETVREAPSSDGHSLSVDSNPECISLYEGPVAAGHFEGRGVMRDEGGRAVYDGEFRASLREGRGKVCFTDAHHHTQWTYEGELRDDETCGNCIISLADSTAVANVTERYTLIHYTGAVAAPPRAAPRRGLLPEEMAALLSSNLKRRMKVFTGQPSALPSQHKVLDLIKSVYVREEAYGYRVSADRFLVSDVASDKYLVESAQTGASCPLSRFLATFLPHQCAWQDASTLSRALPDGEWRFVDGSIYKGALQGGKPDGVGVYNHWPTNTLYEGSMRNGVPDGQGKLVTGDSKHRAVYDGQLIQGSREGKGTLTTHEGGATIRGVWASDKLDTGAMTVEIAPRLMKELDVPFARYEGYVKDGIPEGEATLTYDTGKVFRGVVANGIRQGRGELRDELGNVIIDGNFNNNVPEGLIKFARFPDNFVYKGEMSKGQRQGMGQMVAIDSDMVLYEGTWANDVPHGRGIYRAPDGEYEGEFRNGKRHGKGRFVFKERPLANGKQRVYEGDWNNDVPDGTGKYSNDDGLECVYKLNKGVIVQESIKSYRPTCGKAPVVSAEPTVMPCNFRPYPEKDVPWRRSKHASIGNVLQTLTQAAPTWSQTAGKSTTFIDPTRVVPLERINM